MTRTVAFSGSRTVQDQDTVAMLLEGLAANRWPDDERLTIVHGGAAGLDTLVDRYARGPMKGIVDVVSVPAEWDRCGPECPATTSHRRTRHVPAPRASWAEAVDGVAVDPLEKQTYCPWAGGRRNQKILDDYRPDRLIAVVDKPLHQSRGTADMVKRAKQARIPVTLIDITGGNP